MLAVAGPVRDREAPEALARDPLVASMGKGDFLLILGGSGVFEPRRDRMESIRRLSCLPCTVLFLDGASDDYDAVDDYPEFPWNGGMTNDVWRGVRRLCRGQVFAIDGHTFAVMGGACTPGRDDRGKYWDWWPEQDPSAGEVSDAVSNLAGHGGKVDFVFSCECPTEWISRTGGPGRSAASDACSAVLSHCSYGHWYFSCLGREEEFPDLRATCVGGRAARVF